MKFETLLVEMSEPVAKVTINRPDKLNALSELVLTELKQLLIEFKSKKHPKVLGMILTGSGEKAFIAGADIKAMSEMSPAEGEAFGKLGQEVTELMESLPFPVIACVNGFALGGGCEIAMSCDYIYATQTAVFGQPEVNLGLIPGFGGCVRLMRYVGMARAKELIYTGRNIKAPEAHTLGLVNELFENTYGMMEAATHSLQMVASKSPTAVAQCKQIINAAMGVGTHEGLEMEKAAFRRVFESEDKREGVAAFLEKRKPVFPGK